MSNLRYGFTRNVFGGSRNRNVIVGLRCLGRAFVAKGLVLGILGFSSSNSGQLGLAMVDLAAEDVKAL
jgi:hypothetical protein